MQWVDWLPWALYRSAKWQRIVGFRDKQGQDVWALVCGCEWRVTDMTMSPGWNKLLGYWRREILQLIPVL